MPRASAATLSPQDICSHLDALLQEAARFVPHERSPALMHKWLPRSEPKGIPEERLLAMGADAILLSADLALSQPSASGSTAFDRLARSRAGAPAAEMAAVEALCRARFRLLRLEQNGPATRAAMRDVVTDENLQVIDVDLPPLSAGTMLFGRVVMLGAGIATLQGSITPLDAAALAVARGHVSAGATGAAASARWAEAVYMHVVRNGTLDIPGLNRPSADFYEEDEPDDHARLLGLAMEWAALGDAAPDEAMLKHTREFVTLSYIVTAIGAAVMMRASENEAMAVAFERLLMVLLETVLRRERSGSGTLTLDGIRQALDTPDIPISMVPKLHALFASLRQRLVGSSGAAPAGDPALERLMQRIQALRAKTVEQGCTEQEALAAAEKVAELLDRYGLSLGELDFRAQPCEGIGIQTQRRRMGPIDNCVTVIAKFFDCRVWLENAKGMPLRYVFFGLRGDVAAAQYLYEMVERTFETETDAFRAGDVYAGLAGERRSATHSFQIGLGHGINVKLRALQEARNTSRRSESGRDLVPVKAAMVDEEMEKLGLNLQQRGTAGRRKRVLSDAFDAGQAAGERFDYRPGITKAA